MLISYTAALKAPMLELEQERKLIEQWQGQGDTASLQALITSHARQVHACARKVNSKIEHHEDLVAEGVIGLIKAADKFELAKNVRFSTYAHWWVLNSVRAANARLKNIVDIPLSAQSATSALSLVNPVGANGESVDLDDVLPSEDPTPEECVISRSEAAELRKTMVSAMQDLSVVERDIVVSRSLSSEPEPLQALADRLGLGRDRLRQVERRALSRLKFALMARGLSTANPV